MADVRDYDQQELKAKLLLKDTERRTRLLEAASGKPGMIVCFTLGVFLATALILLGDLKDWFPLSCLLAATFFTMIEGYNRRTNKRIDAIIALLQEDNLMGYDKTNTKETS